MAVVLQNKQGTTTETVTPAAPVPPSPAYASPYESSSPNRTCTIEEFMAANAPAPKDANLFSMASNSSRASAPQPVAVGARSSRDTVELNERYQHYGLQRPKFHFSGSGEDGWSVTTTFLGKEFEERRLFNSKHEAKEAVSGKCLKMIKIMEEKGKLQKPQKGKKKVGMDQFADDQRDKNETVNYIGLLLEFQRSKSYREPVYKDYQLGTQFSCVLTVDNLPTQEFGSKDALFSSKKNARHNAARCAVQHYKKKGIWPDDSTDVGGIKKRKTGAQPAALPTPSPISLGACISGAMSAKDGESYASQVVKLAIALDLGAPEWRYTEQSAEQFHTVGCFFNARGRHHGPFGEARNVFGKKAAKEACARKTLASLQKVRDERLGLRRPATASSSDSGAGGSSPQQFEDEVGGGGIAIGLGAGLDIDPEDSFDEDEYDDAMEELKGDV